jgi:hypothetical protein
MIRRLERCVAQCIAFAGVVVICMGIVCTDQTLPQLFAHIASLDPDHHVVMYPGPYGIDLLLLHDSSPAAVAQQTQAVIRSTSSEPAHVIHFSNGTTQVNQAATPLTDIKLQVARYIVATVSIHVGVFVPEEIFADSRPPPQRTVILFNRSTPLLI